ncbi:hypothetical protein GJ744_002963 [Endocarpon pusillum]|uniref:Uncharacterized protein n=1 Tax=Endocarpon pusillum TaxID=364733 RepID=A0A8H7E0V0_9EURO|nr:hypothetical protein GJ744_002963 [Endocarpon pusillum]
MASRSVDTLPLYTPDRLPNYTVESTIDIGSSDDRAPFGGKLLGSFTVICLILNPTIDAGIFIAPGKVLAATGSPGGALIVWVVGGITQLCGFLIWLELGLSIPFRTIPDGREVSVPRSGGEKNYIEFIFKKYSRPSSCIFGIASIILGSLAGNEIAIGIFMLEAADHPRSSRSTNWIGLSILTFVGILRAFSFRGVILLNNLLAVLKALFLVACIILA